MMFSIVGIDDGGKLFSEKDYEEYKQKIKESWKNRLYVVWKNLKDKECKTIGPTNLCFCGHRFKEHAFDNVNDKNIHCKFKKCLCSMYSYIPVCKKLTV